MKKIIIIVLLILFLCPLNSQAQDICFDDATAGRMVVVLEQAKIAEQQLLISADKDMESQKQIGILQGTIKLLEDRISLHEAMRKTDAAFSDMKDKAFEQQLKAATPTFMQNLGKYFTGAGIGAILTGIVIIIL